MCWLLLGVLRRGWKEEGGRWKVGAAGHSIQGGWVQSWLAKPADRPSGSVLRPERSRFLARVCGWRCRPRLCGVESLLYLPFRLWREEGRDRSQKFCPPGRAGGERLRGWGRRSCFPVLGAGWGARGPSWTEARRSGGAADPTLRARPRGGAVTSSSPSPLDSKLPSLS